MNNISARRSETMAARPRGKPLRSKNLLGETSSSAMSPENASGLRISCPTYKIARIIIKQSRGFTILGKIEDVEDDRQ